MSQGRNRSQLQTGAPSTEADEERLHVAAGRNSFRYWFQLCQRIPLKNAFGEDGNLDFPVMTPLQDRLEAALEQQQADKMPMRTLACKVRQDGSSRFHMCRAYWMGRNHPIEVAVIADDKNTTPRLLNMWEVAYQQDRFGDHRWGNVAACVGFPRKFSHGTTLFEETANDPRAGQGGTPQVLISCVPGDTPVIVEHGWVKPICEVKPGERLLTHNGNPATVTAVVGKPNNKGDLYKLDVACAQYGIAFTYDHKIYTQRGWLKAEDIIPGDHVSMPIRKINGTRKSTMMPLALRADAKSQGDEVALDREFGFFCGYYLAEGHLKKNSSDGKRMCGIIFTRHRSESEYADRAFRAVEKLVKTQTITDRKGKLSSENAIYSATLGQWIFENFGRTQGKQIPDWVFECSVEFVEGLLTGYFCGDGSKGKRDKYDRVSATTVQCSIATQIRDLIAALRIGWASLDYRPGGNNYGRNCRANYTMRYGGQAGTKLRALMGLPSHRCAGLRKAGAGAVLWGEHYWLPVRGVTRVPCDEVYDLSVDHPDHSFRTLDYSISNSETAHYRSSGKSTGETVFQSIANSVPDLPGTWMALESTANGKQGVYYKTYLKAVTLVQWQNGIRGNGFIKCFAAWFENRDYDDTKRTTEREAGEIMATLTEREVSLIERYGPKNITPGRLAWRRRKLAEPHFSGDEEKFDQEYPHSMDSAFVSSGTQVFDHAGLETLATVVNTGSGPQTGKIENGVFVRTGLMEAWLRLWEVPIPGCSYLLHADFMEGEQSAGDRKQDCHAVGVIRAAYVDPSGVMHKARLVAAIKPECRVNIDVMIGWIADLHRMFGECLVVPEVNSAFGVIALLNAAGVHNLWTRTESEEQRRIGEGKQLRKRGWLTTEPLREQIIANLQRYVREREIEIGCPRLLEELQNFITKANGRKEAAGGYHDDWVMSFAIGVQCLPAATRFAHRMPVVEMAEGNHKPLGDWGEGGRTWGGGSGGKDEAWG